MTNDQILNRVIVGFIILAGIVIASEAIRAWKHKR